MSVNQRVPFPGNTGVTLTAEQPGTLFPLLARTQSGDPAGLGAGIYVTEPMHNECAAGVAIFVDTTTSGTGTVTVKLQVQDPVTDGWTDIAGATTTAINDPANEYFVVYPGVTVAANVGISAPLGHTWRAHATVATASVTFSVGGIYLG